MQYCVHSLHLSGVGKSFIELNNHACNEMKRNDAVIVPLFRSYMSLDNPNVCPLEQAHRQKIEMNVRTILVRLL